MNILGQQIYDLLNYSIVSDVVEALPIPESPIGYYRGDTITGTTLMDLSGNGYHGNITGAVQSGDYLVSDGSDDFVDLSSLFNAISNDTQGTIVLCGKFSSGQNLYLSFGDSTTASFIIFSMNPTLINYAYDVDGQPSGVDNFFVRRSGTYSLDTDYTLVFVQDVTTGVKLYLNGVEVASDSTGGTPNNKWIGTHTAIDNMLLFSLDNSTSNIFQASSLKAFAYYNRRLTAEEIGSITL